MAKICFIGATSSQLKMFNKIAIGLRGHGVEAGINLVPPARGNVVGCWGWRKGKHLRNHGRDVLVFERAYLGDRFHWTSVGWNGLNGRADFCLPGEVSSERFHQFFTMKPWRDSGSDIIIMGQVSGDASLDGQDLTSFYEMVGKKLKKHYNRQVYFRPHPLAKNRPFKPKLPIFEGNLQEALDTAFLVVTFNSNSAVDAVINGTPTLCFDRGCMAYEVTGHRIEDRLFPDRERWAARLAHCQWAPEEIDNADFWHRLKNKLEPVTYGENKFEMRTA